MNEILQIFYLITPGIFANWMPLFTRNTLTFLAKPVDFGMMFRAKRLLGDHKTVRGFVTGTIASIVILYIQRWLYQYPIMQDISIVPYDQYSPLLLGFLIGFGALFGDAVKSFFKRRVNRKPGERWIPWDQIDAPIGALLFVSLAYPLTLVLMVKIVVLAFVAHITFRHLGYYLGITKEKW